MEYFWRLLSLLMLLLPALGSAGFAQTQVPLNDPHIRYVGRWNMDDPAVYHSYWGGAYMRLRFTGTTLKLKLAVSTSLAVGVDGGLDQIRKAKSGIVDLTPQPLEPGTHVATIAANWQDTELQVQGVVLDPGARTLPLEDHSEIVEFIGDSITTGDRTRRGDVDAYPWLVGKALKCQQTEISFCGITLTDHYHYGYHGAPQRGMSVAYFLSREPDASSNSDWDFHQYTPAVVVINLGTNDHFLHVSAARFQENYYAFVTAIRGKFPNAAILALRPFHGFFADEIQHVVQKRTDAKDLAIHYIDTSGWLTRADTSDETHPTEAGHAIIAAKLAPIVNALLFHHAAADNTAASNN